MNLSRYMQGSLTEGEDLLVISSLDQLLFMLKIFVVLFTKQATLMRWSAVLVLPPQIVFPDIRVVFNYLVVSLHALTTRVLKFSSTTED